jgi:hydrogenase expression/formation protein HypD
MNLAAKAGVCIATFGDLMRVPGPDGKTLQQAQAEGADIEVVYSPLDALALARKRPEQTIVFLGIGFETTGPTVAATVQMAHREKLSNFAVLGFHKLVPPALNVLLGAGPTDEDNGSSGIGIDAFLLPGHVSIILGIEPYRFMADVHSKPSVIAGFDPADILQSLLLMVDMRKKNKPDVINQYNRVVSDVGNKHARAILFDVFFVSDALWRGIGEIPASGLGIRAKYENYDAWKRFTITLPEVPNIKGCRCGDVLRGLCTPKQCSLFGKTCTPGAPVGPCMVSTEGSCAAYFKYGIR